MNQDELITHEAGQYAYFAAQDARIKSYANKTLFSDKQKLRAEQVKLGLDMVYGCDNIFVTYRKNFIAVKVANHTVIDSTKLKLLEQDYEKEGITKVVSKLGVIYRIPKN